MTTSPTADLPFTVGDRFSQDMVFDREGIVAFATLAGDMNPLGRRRSGGDIVTFDGTLRNSEGTGAVSASSANLVFRTSATR